MNAEISRINSQIEKLKKRRARLMADERKAKERALLAAAEKRGLLDLSVQQIESIFSSINQTGDANVPNRTANPSE